MKRAYYGLLLLPLGAFGLAACPSFGVDYCVGDACGPSDASTGDEQVLPPNCDPTKDPKDSPACVDDSIGIFVSASGSDSNAGTKSSPLKTIGAAVGKTNEQHDRVYVCDGTYAETVKLTGPAKIYGGFACADWSYAGTLPKVGPAKSGYALDVESVSGVVIAEDLELDAPSGQAPGESSVAVFVTQSTNVLLRRVTAKSGDGAAGADAVATSNYDADAGAAPRGNDASTSLGAGTKECDCADGTKSFGGAGGGTLSAGDDGGPQIPPFDGHGMGGVYSAGCGTGKTGNSAPEGDGGTPGASVSGSASSVGWTTNAGISGVSGGPGQGGGGGSGGAVTGMNNEGGGSGGCGGCGGAGGAGGGSGGSTFAVLVFQSTLTIDTCTIQTGAGGAGKAGGTAQGGQSGGFPGNPAQSGIGCVGGTGGTGGAGAGGGGGAGGNAIAIGYVGTKPTVTGGSMQEGNAGAHGAGGNGAASNDGLPGADGIKADLQELP